MAFKSSFFLLTIFVIIAIATAEPEPEPRFGTLGSLGSWNRNCGNNAEYKKCGSRCPVTCANLANPPSCTGCTAGCFCRPGFFRNGAGACVLFANCA